VALYVTGDKTVLQNVRLHGFQDTLFTDIASEAVASRVYINDSFSKAIRTSSSERHIGDRRKPHHYLSSRKTSVAVRASRQTRVNRLRRDVGEQGVLKAVQPDILQDGLVTRDVQRHGLNVGPVAGVAKSFETVRFNS